VKNDVSGRSRKKRQQKTGRGSVDIMEKQGKRKKRTKQEGQDNQEKQGITGNLAGQGKAEMQEMQPMQLTGEIREMQAGEADELGNLNKTNEADVSNAAEEQERANRPEAGTGKKKARTPEQLIARYRKRFRITLSVLIVFAALTGVFFYFNYDYLAFKIFLTSSYIYTETLDDLYKKYLDIDTKGWYYNDFDNFVIAATTERIRAERDDRYTYLYTPAGLERSHQLDKEEAALSEITFPDDKTVYLKLTNFTKYTLEFMNENQEKLKSRPNIIIDLRGNRGGDIDIMVDISGMFLPRKSVVAVDRFRWYEHVYRSNKDQPLKYEKIIILQDENTASASENMIAALSENLDNVELIGTKTFGKGIGQFTLPLRRGYAVKATILKWLTPTGRNIQGVGIEPDIEYTGDDIIQYALSRIS